MVVQKSFDYFGLNYLNYLKVDKGLYRPSDIAVSAANPEKAKRILGWSAESKVEDVIIQMCLSAKLSLEK